MGSVPPAFTAFCSPGRAGLPSAVLGPPGLPYLSMGLNDTAQDPSPVSCHMSACFSNVIGWEKGD